VEVDPGVGAAFVDFHFSFRMDSFQMALACSSEPLNGLSVPRDLRYSAFVMFDILHHRTGGAVCSESYLELSSVLLASIRVHTIIRSRPRFAMVNFPDRDRSARSTAGSALSIPPKSAIAGP
jgi:hypothetical protein